MRRDALGVEEGRASRWVVASARGLYRLARLKRPHSPATSDSVDVDSRTWRSAACRACWRCSPRSNTARSGEVCHVGCARMGATPTAAASVPSDVQRVTVRCCTLHAFLPTRTVVAGLCSGSRRRHSCRPLRCVNCRAVAELEMLINLTFPIRRGHSTISPPATHERKCFAWQA